MLRLLTCFTSFDANQFQPDQALLKAVRGMRQLSHCTAHAQYHNLV